MITRAGRVLVNNVLVGIEPVIGTHLSLGLNIINGVNPSGSDLSIINKFHSPYIVDNIKVNMPGVIAIENTQYLVFNGQADQSARYMADNISLITRNEDRPSLNQTNLVSVGVPGWTPLDIAPNNVPLLDPDPLDPNNPTKNHPSNVQWFTDEGYLLARNNVARIYNGYINISGVNRNDILAFPFAIHNVSALTQNLTVFMGFGYNIGTSEQVLAYIYKTLRPAGAGRGIHFEDAGATYPASNPANDKSGIVSATNQPIPFLFQARVSEFIGSASLEGVVINGYGVEFSTTQPSGPDPNNPILFSFGSLKHTPDEGSDSSRVNVAHKPLPRTLYKTTSEAYINAEYRLTGV